MNIKIKLPIRALFAVLLAVGLSDVGLSLFFTMYVHPLMHPQRSIAIDPTYVTTVLFGAAALFLALMFVFVLDYARRCVKQKRWLKSVYDSPRFFYRYLLVTVVVGGSLAFVSNIVLWHYVVPEFGYQPCPIQIGHKKNPLRDYVLDVSQCEGR